MHLFNELDRRIKFRKAERARRSRLFMLGASLGIATLAWYAGGKDLLVVKLAKQQAIPAEQRAEVRQREEASDPRSVLTCDRRTDGTSFLRRRLQSSRLKHIESGPTN